MIKDIDVQQGQVWKDSSFKEFMILHLYTDSQGHTWVHYRQNDCTNCREYSCWIESFLERFNYYS
jgi:hypothetical protein